VNDAQGYSSWSSRARNDHAPQTARFVKRDSMKITVLTNGPLLVEVSSQICDQNGKPYALQTAAKVALCRCGASLDKPFCDGSHARVGFLASAQRPPTAPPPSASAQPTPSASAPTRLATAASPPMLRTKSEAPATLMTAPSNSAAVATWENEGGNSNGRSAAKPKGSR
jgi:CDGSH-type Zn-finger protein